MPAHSNEFPWPSHYGNYCFFEDRMKGHSRVRSIEQQSKGRYLITLDDGRDLQIFVCECYSFGVAEYMETTNKLGRLDAIIINSNWCGYTDEAKIQCRNKQVGLFTIGDFMAALNLRDFWMYLDEQEKERLRKLGLL